MQCSASAVPVQCQCSPLFRLQTWSGVKLEAVWDKIRVWCSDWWGHHDPTLHPDTCHPPAVCLDTHCMAPVHAEVMNHVCAHLSSFCVCYIFQPSTLFLAKEFLSLTRQYLLNQEKVPLYHSFKVYVMLCWLCPGTRLLARWCIILEYWPCCAHSKVTMSWCLAGVAMSGQQSSAGMQLLYLSQHYCLFTLSPGHTWSSKYEMMRRCPTTLTILDYPYDYPPKNLSGFVWLK